VPADLFMELLSAQSAGSATPAEAIAASRANVIGLKRV
jgi:hypothetical protein